MVEQEEVEQEKTRTSKPGGMAENLLIARTSHIQILLRRGPALQRYWIPVVMLLPGWQVDGILNARDTSQPCSLHSEGMRLMEGDFESSERTEQQVLSPTGGHSRRRPWLPLRVETLFLLAGFVWTIGAKCLLLRRATPAVGLSGWLAVLTPDLVFYVLTALVFSLLVFCRPARWTARFMLLVSILIMLWAGANAAWLMATGVQLQPGILAAIGHEPMQFWPVVKLHLGHRPVLASLLICTGVAAGIATGYRLIRPEPFRRDRRSHRRHLMGGGALAILSLLTLLAASRQPCSGTFEAGLGFSSPWYALVSMIQSDVSDDSVAHSRRLIQTDIGQTAKPLTSPAHPPNVVVLLLESVSHSATSLRAGGEDTTPNLRRLAEEGVEFVSTHIPVPSTTDAIWSTMLGVAPDISGDSGIESVLMDAPLQGLPTVLRQHGYRSAFFQMAKGSFECAPGLTANLGFDWAWFRENLQDPSANLGYLGGDDVRMLEPAMSWACGAASPFLLVMITSASHDPFEVPAWYGQRHESRRDSYLQAVRFSDHFLGLLREELRRRGLDQNTILCVIGDHGESFRLQGHAARWIPYEEIIRVPWVIHWPGHLTARQRVTGTCSQFDLPPTIAAMIGAAESWGGCEGLNALGPIPPDRKLYFASAFRDSPRGYLVGNRKCVYWPYNDRVYVYNLEEDPDEKRPGIIGDDEKQLVKDDVTRWITESRISIAPRRFRQRFLYDHWRTFASGRSGWAYYVP